MPQEKFSGPLDRFPECGKPIDLDRGANLAVDAAKVPKELTHLIPFVNKWSFDNLDDQDIFVTLMERSRPDEIDQLNAAFCDDARGDIRAWAASLSFDKHAEDFTDDDWKHPYWQVLNVIKLCETTSGNGDALAVQKTQRRFKHEIRKERYAVATTNADTAFRNFDYARYVALHSEFDDLLTDTQRKKLAIATRKASP